jgi:hypothetical protein
MKLFVEMLKFSKKIQNTKKFTERGFVKESKESIEMFFLTWNHKF